MSTDIRKLYEEIWKLENEIESLDPDEDEEEIRIAEEELEKLEDECSEFRLEEMYKSEEEIEDELTEQYGTISVAYTTVNAGKFLHDYDEPFFNSVLAESLYFECPICEAKFDNEDDAKGCCRDCG